jgi:hypothetical protein
VRWETFFTFGDATTYGEDHARGAAPAAAACCAAEPKVVVGACC